MSFKNYKVCILFFLYSFFIFSNVYSTVYYISQSGNDSNNGKSTATPWQTIAKVNSMMDSIVAGDQILFNKGDRFYGTLTIRKTGNSGNHIVIGSYGNESSRPLITGKKLMSNWTLDSGNINPNIYKTTLDLSDTVAHLYVNNKIMTKARYPNSGFLRTDIASGNGGFYDAALNDLSVDLVNADCRIRTRNWIYEIRRVSAFSGGNVTFDTTTAVSGYTNYGYYLDNKFGLLDVENEWYHDRSTGILYFHPPVGDDPNTLQVEAVIARLGITTTNNTHYIKVRDLNISGYKAVGIDFFNGSYKSVTDCYISQTGIYGIRMNGTGHLIENNTLEDNLGSGIFGVITGGTIRLNTLNRTGMIAGYGASGTGYTSIQGNNFKNCTIEFNDIDSSGYVGIRIANANLVKNNVIDYSCLVLNDGGGIDITNCDTLRIIGNMVFNTIGNYESNGFPGTYSCGIYVNGAIMKNSTIQGNTVCYNRYMGILIDHKNTPENNKIIGNLCYNNFDSQMLFTDFSAETYVPAYNTIVKNNILYSLSAYQSTLHLRGHTASGISDYGFFDSNYYCNPYSEYVVRRTRFQPKYVTKVYTLDKWKNSFGEDLNSKSLPFTFSQYGITDTLGGNMITNSQFDTTISPWIGWPSGASVGWENNPVLNSGSMRFRWYGNNDSIGFALSKRYSISAGNYYQVSISSAGKHSGTFCLWGLSSISDNTFSFPQTFFSYDTVRKEYSFTYRADITDQNAYVGVGLIPRDDTVAYFDNVNMYPVSAYRIDSTEKSRIFHNITNATAFISLNGIDYKDIDGNPVTSSIELQPYTSKILVREDFIPTRNLKLKALIEGLYDPATDKMISDTAIVYIRNASSPFAIIDSIKGVLDSSGNGSFDSFNAYNFTDYYLSVKHRNSLETWSGSTVSFASNSLNYDFTTSASQAYGNNLILSETKYCIYSGDVTDDGQIELADLLVVSNAAFNFATGYILEDLNGDGAVDLSDLGIVYNNGTAFVRVSKP